MRSSRTARRERSSRWLDDNRKHTGRATRAFEFAVTEEFQFELAGYFGREILPDAVHLFWRDHLDEHEALRPAGPVKEMYEARGVTADKTIITFCRGGYRSANTFLVLSALGYPQVRNYVGSWAEWGNRDDTQIVVPR
ncbi:MAG: sulfurtransferase [Hyphomicrobiaceae bacterium]